MHLAIAQQKSVVLHKKVLTNIPARTVSSYCRLLIHENNQILPYIPNATKILMKAKILTNLCFL